MAVKRIVTDIAVTSVAETKQFYVDLLDLDVVMDQGWIATLSGDAPGPVQLSIMTQGGSGAPVPRMSVEVDDVDATYAKAKEMGAEITYDLIDEPWGVRRFYVRDPAGQEINILSHV